MQSNVSKSPSPSGPNSISISLESVKQAPKVLLHDHLDGGLRPATILELADDCGWYKKLPSHDPKALHAYFVAGAEAGDLLAYLATFEHTTAVMQSQDSISRVAYEAALDLAEDGVVYAEIRFAPELHQQAGLQLEAIVEAVQDGFRRGEREAASAGRPITVNTIICAMRTEPRSEEIANLAVSMRERDPRVVAFDLAGAETGWPPSLHQEALRIARDNLLHLTIHASEPPDLELIHDAVRLGAERIGHGVRIATDIDASTQSLGPLAPYIRDRQIMLELAPTCNVQIGAVSSISDHPIGPLLRMGFCVGVNTDNRLMSNVSMTGEIHAVATAFDLSWSEVGKLATNAMESSFASWSTKRYLVDSVLKPTYDSLQTAKVIQE
jgi:adenosine deaminase